MKPERDRVYYSGEVRGDERNYNWAISMNWQDGYLTINQHEKGRITESVLLSPKQVEALIAFNTDPVAESKAA